jgi:hypothetical protein
MKVCGPRTTSMVNFWTVNRKLGFPEETAAEDPRRAQAIIVRKM